MRDAYPGINAVTLMELAEPPDSRQAELLPVVRYAVERRMVLPQRDFERGVAHLRDVLLGDSFLPVFIDIVNEGFGLTGEPFDTRLAIGVGADLEIRALHAPQTVADPDVDGCRVDRLAFRVVDCEVGGTVTAQVGFEDRRFRCARLRLLNKNGGERNRDDEHDDECSRATNDSVDIRLA